MSKLKIWETGISLNLESGDLLPNLTIGYHTFGTLNKLKSNVVWVCHAFTANSNPTEWWTGLVGNDFVINPKEHFIVCANIIGSCYGSTNPLSLNPLTGKPFYSAFPLITIRDMAKAHILLAKQLKIDKIKLLIGGSMGGQQVLEWSIIQPDFMENILVIATNAVHSPFGIAFNESQRMSILADASYFKNTQDGGKLGMKAARSTALISYRSYNTYLHFQKETETEKLDDYKVASYQRYQGDKLANRFNAYSYVGLSKIMDSHNVGRTRNSIEEALKKIKAKALCISIKSDILFPKEEQKYLHENIEHSKYELIDSVYGHDGFLLETKPLTKLILKHKLL
jgi:homoserine O-acetyltransferase